MPPKVDLVDLVSEGKGDKLREDTSFEEDLQTDEEDPVKVPKPMEEDSLQDSSEESYQEASYI